MTTANQVYKNIVSTFDDPQVGNQYLDDRLKQIESMISGGSGYIPIMTTPNTIVKYSGSAGQQFNTSVFSATTVVADDTLYLAKIDNPTKKLNIGTTASVIDFNNTPVINFNNASRTVVAPVNATDANGIILDNAAITIGLEYATASFAGILSATAQTIAGAKTFNNGIILPTLASVGVVHNDATGNLTTSLVVNADIANSTITDAKLATIATAGKVEDSSRFPCIHRT